MALLLISLYYSESLNVSVFNWVHTLSMGYREALLTDKRGGSKNQRALQYSRRLALAVSAYRQFLLCVQEMLSPSTAGRVDLDEDQGESETVEAREERLLLQKQAAESLMCKLTFIFTDFNFL